MQLNVACVCVSLSSVVTYNMYDDKHVKTAVAGGRFLHASCMFVCVFLCVCLQVVREAYSRFTEESLTQSMCDKPMESTEVTIKVSGGNKKPFKCKKG